MINNENKIIVQEKDFLERPHEFMKKLNEHFWLSVVNEDQKEFMSIYRGADLVEDE